LIFTEKKLKKMATENVREQLKIGKSKYLANVMVHRKS